MKFKTELFAHFVYSLDLTYEELIETEKELIAILEEIMASKRADHIHYEPLGDVLKMQCSFSKFDTAFFHSICDELAPHMDTKMEVRLLFVDKNLDSIILYSISKKKWKEKVFSLPPAGIIGKSLIKETL